MNKNIKLAVAGAILATASVANAGIVIPAGEWTLDVSGNVNTYASWSKPKGNASITGGLATTYEGVNGTNNTGYNNSTMKFGNGLLPNFLSIGGSTRQNDLDVAFVISLQPGSAQNSALNQVGSQDVGTTRGANGGLNNRQAFITVGDKSWGSVKIGKDLGIFASDAILNDITLLGVGGAYAGAAGNTSLGRIGFGYIYADWKPQIAYTTPNFSGLQATVGISQAFAVYGDSAAGGSAASAATSVASSYTNSAPAYEGKASYAFNANGVDGKIWVSGIAQKVGSMKLGISGTTVGTLAAVYNDDTTAYGGDIGANVKVAGFDLTGYYYSGSGLGTTGQFLNAYGARTGGGVEARDSQGGYVQAKYTLPTKTIAALSWGRSQLDQASGEATNTSLVDTNDMWDAMLIHPLTKHLNLVAEYSNQQSENHKGERNTANVGSLGAILFF